MARLIRFNRRELQRMTEEHVEELTGDVLRRARVTCPRDTGELRASLDSDVQSSGSRVVGTVGTRLEYAVYVHEGRGPVRARPGGVLGPLPAPYPRFVRSVGPAEGQPWLLQALQSAQPYPVRRG